MSPGSSATHEVVFMNLGPVACKVSVTSECQDSFLRYGQDKTWESREKVLMPARKPEPASFSEQLMLSRDVDANRLPTREEVRVEPIRRVHPDGRREPLEEMYLNVDLVAPE